MWKIIQITFFIYLVILSVLDIRTRKLPMWLLAAVGSVSYFLSLSEERLHGNLLFGRQQAVFFNDK